LNTDKVFNYVGLLFNRLPGEPGWPFYLVVRRLVLIIMQGALTPPSLHTLLPFPGIDNVQYRTLYSFFVSQNNGGPYQKAIVGLLAPSAWFNYFRGVVGDDLSSLAKVPFVILLRRGT
jgi:hypothetical protein